MTESKKKPCTLYLQTIIYTKSINNNFQIPTKPPNPSSPSETLLTRNPQKKLTTHQNTNPPKNPTTLNHHEQKKTPRHIRRANQTLATTSHLRAICIRPNCTGAILTRRCTFAHTMHTHTPKYTHTHVGIHCTNTGPSRVDGSDGHRSRQFIWRIRRVGNHRAVCSRPPGRRS